MSRFNPGDTVMAFCQLGLNKSGQWHKMTYLKAHGENHIVEGYGQSRILESRNIATFTPTTEEAVAEFGRKNVRELHDMIVKGAAELLPPSLTGQIVLDEAESVILLCNDSIAIGPEFMVRRSIGSFREHPCWGVTVYVPTPGSRNEPPGVDDAPAGQATNNADAALLALQTVFLWHAKGFFNALAEAAWANTVQDSPYEL